MIDPEPDSTECAKPTLPQALEEDLAALYRPDVSVPVEVDQAVLGAARAHFARQRRRRMILRVAPLAAAAAAVILLVIPVLRFARPQGREAAPGVLAATPEDIDRNGRVDILDAFTLARQLEAGAAAEPGWDVNYDGDVDGADVDVIAMLAVRINGG
jgi:hypothetical protein